MTDNGTEADTDNHRASGKGHDEAQSGTDLRSYGRKRGRKLSERQLRLLADLLPRVAVDLSQPAPEPLTAVFASAGRLKDVWLEIGFGGAEHLVWQAEHNRDIGLIGCEPFEDGVVKALSAIEENGLDNICIHADDARRLLRWLPADSIAKAFILFPDPWPKKKHAKRRLVSTATLDLLARVMRSGAELRVATDIEDYLRAILVAFHAHGAFVWLANGPSDWRFRDSDWPPTRYERKALREGRRGYFLRFQRC